MCIKHTLCFLVRIQISRFRLTIFKFSSIALRIRNIFADYEKFLQNLTLLYLNSCTLELNVYSLLFILVIVLLTAKATIFAKTLEKNHIFFLFSPPPPIQCWFLVRLCSALGHNQAAQLLSFWSGNHIFGPTLFRGQGAREKA